MRVLIVEDDTYAALYLEEILQELGHDVIGSADTGDDAIAYARQLKPEVVLMDIKIRGNLDGIETAVRLRDSFDIPSVFVTGNADEAIRKRARSARPLGFVEKPLMEDDIISLMKQVENQSRL